MGALGKALRRINYDLGINQAGDYFEGQRKKKEQKELYDTVLDAYNQTQNRMKGLDTGLDPADYTFEQGEQASIKPLNPLSSIRTTGAPSLPMGLSPGIISNIQQANKPEINAGTPGDIILGDILDRPERYKRAQGAVGDFQSSIVPMLLNPDVDQNQVGKLNVLGQLLSGQVENLKPGIPKISERDPFKKYVATDTETGEEKIIQEAAEKPKPFDIEGSFKNKGTKTYWTYDKQLGTPVDTGIPYDQGEGKTTVNVGDKSPDYSSDYGSVVTGINEIKKLKETKLTKRKKDGKLEFFEPGTKEAKVFENEKEFNNYKETKKKEYNTAAVQMLKKYDIKTNRGLLKDRGGAVSEIRKQIEKGKSITEAIDLFEKYNPDMTEEEKDLLEKYFTIHRE